MKINIEQKVIKAFRTDPRLKDQPDKLLYQVWLDILPDELKSMPVADFFKRCLDGRIKMPSLMTIDRSRRQVQETYPEYAGKFREERLDKADGIRQKIHDNRIEDLL